jgi:hypothetical protein
MSKEAGEGSAEKRSVSFPSGLWEWVEAEAAKDNYTVSGYLQELAREARKRSRQQQPVEAA